MQQISAVNRWEVDGKEYNSPKAIVQAAEDQLGHWIATIRPSVPLGPGQQIAIHDMMVQDRKKLIQYLMLIDEAINLEETYDQF